MAEIWIKANYRMLTPAIIKPYLPFDGIFSYYYAQTTGFKYKNAEGYIYDNLPVARYRYIDELPIQRTEYNGKWFYNISGMLFDEGVERGKTAIIRKYMENTQLWLMRKPNIGSLKWKYEEKSARGKEKAHLVAVETVYVPEFSILLEIKEENEDFVVEILESVKAIGKKVNQGYGFVEFVDYECVNVKDFIYEGILIRPVPKRLVTDNGYAELPLRLFAPYYVKNEKYTDVCYIDRKFL